MSYNTINDFQKIYVEDAYNMIAKSFDTTRAYMWNKTAEFLNDITEKDCVVDVGCGNGKNMIYLKNKGYYNLKGCDISEKQVEICKSKKLDVIKADNTCLPYNDNQFDYVLSVAVIHHLTTNDLRENAIRELVRICKPNGKIFIQVWGSSAIGSSIDNKINMDTVNDVLVPWRSTDGNLMAHRYYHLFAQGELESICKKIDNVNIGESYEERHNFGVILSKKPI